MNLCRKLVMFVTTLAFTWAQVAFAANETDYQGNIIERAKTAISGELVKLKTLGGQVTDEAGNELSATQIFSGQYKTVIYYPESSSLAHSRGVHFKYLATGSQSVAVSAHKKN